MTHEEPIPALDEHGLLPDGVYDCDMETFEARFVTGFPASRTRRDHFEGFGRLRAETDPGATAAATQWIDGSFVTSKQDPGDIDLVTFMDLDQLNEMSEDKRAVVKRLLDGREATRAQYGVHTFLVPSCDKSHGFYAYYEQQRAYWRKWFGRTRQTRAEDGTLLPGPRKGMVAMALGDGALAPSIPVERGAT